jgi:hypothetical protein
MRSMCLAERTFGIGIVAPSMLRESAVAETGNPTGTTEPVRSRGGGRSPTAARGEGGSEREDERLQADADARLSGSLGTMRGRSFARGASTPWKRVSGQHGGGMSAQSRARNEAGVMIRQREARRDDFFTRHVEELRGGRQVADLDVVGRGELQEALVSEAALG